MSLRRYEYKYGQYSFPKGCENASFYLATDVDEMVRRVREIVVKIEELTGSEACSRDASCAGCSISLLALDALKELET